MAVHRRGARAAIPPPPRHETFDPMVDAGNVQFVLVTYVEAYNKQVSLLSLQGKKALSIAHLIPQSCVQPCLNIAIKHLGSTVQKKWM